MRCALNPVRNLSRVLNANTVLLMAVDVTQNYVKIMFV
jgi:hypothetical protein